MTNKETELDSTLLGDIVIVDDTLASLKLLTEILNKAGYHVRPASDGELALRSIASKSPTLILLDIRMPELDGFEVCTRLKADPKTRDIPIIFLSSLSDIEDRLHGFELGAVDYIAKPFQAQDVLMRVQVHCQLKQKNLELEAINQQLNQEIKAREQVEKLLLEHKNNLEAQVDKRTAELNKAKQRYETLFAQARDGIVLIDASNGCIANCNPEFERQCGRSIAQLEQTPIWTTQPASQAKLGETLFHQAIQNGMVSSSELDIVQPDGSLVSVEFVAKVIQIDERDYIQAMVRDISERKRIEAERDTSEKRYHLLFEAMQEACYLAELIFDELGNAVDWRYLDSNTALANALHLKREDIIGKRVKELFPHIDDFWIAQPSHTVLTGEPSRLEAFAKISQRYYDCHYYAPAVGQFACILNDITERKLAETERDNSQLKLRTALEDSIQALSVALEMRDPYTAGHQKRVAQLALAIAHEMGLEDSLIQGLYFGGLLHDIGKIAIPLEILNKPGRLNPVEFMLIQQHPQTGFDIVKDIDFPWPVAQMILQHHEHIDGTGYPQKLQGDDILLEAKILAVADTVEAMYSHRPYRPGLGIDKALAEIKRARGTHYQAEVVDACLKIFSEQGDSIVSTILTFKSS